MYTSKSCYSGSSKQLGSNSVQSPCPINSSSFTSNSTVCICNKIGQRFLNGLCTSYLGTWKYDYNAVVYKVLSSQSCLDEDSYKEPLKDEKYNIIPVPICKDSSGKEIDSSNCNIIAKPSIISLKENRFCDSFPILGYVDKCDKLKNFLNSTLPKKIDEIAFNFVQRSGITDALGEVYRNSANSVNVFSSVQSKSEDLRKLSITGAMLSQLMSKLENIIKTKITPELPSLWNKIQNTPKFIKLCMDVKNTFLDVVVGNKFKLDFSPLVIQGTVDAFNYLQFDPNFHSIINSISDNLKNVLSNVTSITGDDMGETLSFFISQVLMPSLKVWSGGSVFKNIFGQITQILLDWFKSSDFQTVKDKIVQIAINDIPLASSGWCISTLKGTQYCLDELYNKCGGNIIDKIMNDPDIKVIMNSIFDVAKIINNFDITDILESVYSALKPQLDIFLGNPENLDSVKSKVMIYFSNIFSSIREVEKLKQILITFWNIFLQTGPIRISLWEKVKELLNNPDLLNNTNIQKIIRDILSLLFVDSLFMMEEKLNPAITELFSSYFGFFVDRFLYFFIDKESINPDKKVSEGCDVNFDNVDKFNITTIITESPFANQTNQNSALISFFHLVHDLFAVFDELENSVVHRRNGYIYPSTTCPEGQAHIITNIQIDGRKGELSNFIVTTYFDKNKPRRLYAGSSNGFPLNNYFYLDNGSEKFNSTIGPASDLFVEIGCIDLSNKVRID